MTQPRLSDRKFGLIFAAVFAIFTIVGWYGFNEVLRWAIICSGAFLALALFAPGVLMPLNRLWGVVTARIHRVINFVLLAAFFYLVIFPFGLIMQLFGRDAMSRAPGPKDASYWRAVTRHTDETTLPDMF